MSAPPGDAAKADLAAKLAAAEAEAAALRLELDQRRLQQSSQLLRMKPNSDVYIDGTGTRESIFSGPKLTGKSSSGPSRSWGLTEAELLAGDEGAEGSMDAQEAKRIVTRRLIIGGGLAGGALALAMFDLPLLLSPPSKPLFFYVAPLVRLQLALEGIEGQAGVMDAFAFLSQLKFAVGSIDAVRENLVSATVLLDDSAKQQTAKQLAFEIVDYLQQADYSNYFDNLGAPTPSQQVEFVRFSLQAIQAARSRLIAFLSCLPQEVVQSARRQFTTTKNVEDAEDGEDAEDAAPSASNQAPGQAPETASEAAGSVPRDFQVSSDPFDSSEYIDEDDFINGYMSSFDDDEDEDLLPLDA